MAEGDASVHNNFKEQLLMKTINCETDSAGDTTGWGDLRWGAINEGDAWYEGHLAEFLIYKETMSGPNRENVEGYLKAKYGIA